MNNTHRNFLNDLIAQAQLTEEQVETLRTLAVGRHLYCIFAQSPDKPCTIECSFTSGWDQEYTEINTAGHDSPQLERKQECPTTAEPSFLRESAGQVLRP